MCFFGWIFFFYLLLLHNMLLFCANLSVMMQTCGAPVFYDLYRQIRSLKMCVKVCKWIPNSLKQQKKPNSFSILAGFSSHCNSSLHPCISCSLPRRNLSGPACSRLEQSCSHTSVTEGAPSLCYEPILSGRGVLVAQRVAAQNGFSPAED